MANKLPWFTHDHNARNDEFIARALDQFGHFGYAAYFMLIEYLHEHGVGDKLTVTKSRLCIQLRSRWPKVLAFLEFAKKNEKIDYRIIAKLGWSPAGTRLESGCSPTSAQLDPGSSSDEVELQINKFRERQGKMKSNLPSTLRQPSANLPLEGEGEGEREKRLITAPPLAVDLKSLPKLRSPLTKSDSQLLELQMPFGAHRGRRVIDLEPDYCAWAVGNVARLSTDIRRALSLRVRIQVEESNARRSE